MHQTIQCIRSFCYDFKTNRCDEIGCACICETAANPDGTCNMVDHKGYRLFKYEKGKILELHYKTKRIGNQIFDTLYRFSFQLLNTL